jgi:hypothetical protein
MIDRHSPDAGSADGKFADFGDFGKRAVAFGGDLIGWDHRNGPCAKSFAISSVIRTRLSRLFQPNA